MDKFYKRLKIFYIFAACFLFITLVPASIYNVVNKNWGLVFIALLAIVLMSAIAILILLYYRNVVVKVAFVGNDTIIKTNGKTYILPSINFTEVNDSKMFGRTFISYSDEQTKKKFYFQKRYSPFKSYTLNIEEMKKHMTSAEFKET